MAQRVVILRSSDTDDPAYSLTHVIRDQILMLTRYGHEVADCCMKAPPTESPEKIATALQQACEGSSAVFVHGLSFPVYTRKDLLPFSQALQSICDTTRNVTFYHWIHSVPSYALDCWDMGSWGGNHILVYPDEHNVENVSKLYNAKRSLAIPHPVDLRTLFNHPVLLWQISDALPGLLSADIVQVYPAAADRLHDKGIERLIYTFAALKRNGVSVCCLVIDSWTGRAEKEDKEQYRTLATDLDLSQDEFVFLTDIIPEFRAMHRTHLALLQQYSTLFIYPTLGEAFGLVLPESCLASGAYPVVNGSLPVLGTNTGEHGSEAYFRPGIQHRSFYDTLVEENLLPMFLSNHAVRARAHVRQHLNIDAIYRDFYAPILSRGIDCSVLN